MTEQIQSNEYSFRLFDFVINDPEVKVDISESEDSSDDGDYLVIAENAAGKDTCADFNLYIFGRTDSLIAFYPFTHDVADSSGNSFNAFLNGPTRTSDRLGNDTSAYYFDGTNDQISISYG